MKSWAPSGAFLGSGWAKALTAWSGRMNFQKPWSPDFASLWRKFKVIDNFSEKEKRAFIYSSFEDRDLLLRSVMVTFLSQGLPSVYDGESQTEGSPLHAEPRHGERWGWTSLLKQALMPSLKDISVSRRFPTGSCISLASSQTVAVSSRSLRASLCDPTPRGFGRPGRKGLRRRWPLR